MKTDNKMNAKRNIDTVSRHYLNAKRSAQEYDGIARGLIRGSTSVPMRGTPQESQQLLIWKRIINWERSNPTRTEDHAILVKRGGYLLLFLATFSRRFDYQLFFCVFWC